MPDFPKPFVILHHVLPDGSAHWDLCLDQGDTLATWQLLEDPATLASGRATALPVRRLPDHRRTYLEYEGPISGNRGHVARVEAGTYTLVAHGPDLWRVRLAGSILIGTYEIVAAGDSGQGAILQRFETR